MDKLVRTLGITGLSKSQVSAMAKDLDEQVEAFRTRPLDAGPYTFLAADALVMKVRENARVVKIAVMVATGVNAEGYREIRPASGGPRESTRLPAKLTPVGWRSSATWSPSAIWCTSTTAPLGSVIIGNCSPRVRE